MMHILKIEWFKLRRYRAFIVLSILTIAGVVGVSYIVYGATSAFRNVSAEMHPAMQSVGDAVIGSPFAFPEVFHTIAYISGFVLVLPGLIMILLITNEYTFRTNRQNVIDGMSRSEFIAGKMLLALLFSVGVTIITFITACLIGLADGGTFSLKNLQYIGFFFVQSLSYMSVAMVIAIFVKRAGIGIGVYFVYTFIAENLLVLLVNGHYKLGYFLPLKSANKLIPPPTMVGKMMNAYTPDKIWLLTTALVWIALCVWLCKYRFEKSDL